VLPKNDRDTDFDASSLKEQNPKRKVSSNEPKWMKMLTDSLNHNFKTERTLLYVLIGLVLFSVLTNIFSRSSPSNNLSNQIQNLERKIVETESTIEKSLRRIEQANRKNANELALIKIACRNDYFEGQELEQYCKNIGQ